MFVKLIFCIFEDLGKIVMCLCRFWRIKAFRVRRNGDWPLRELCDLVDGGGAQYPSRLEEGLTAKPRTARPFLAHLALLQLVLGEVLSPILSYCPYLFSSLYSSLLPIPTDCLTFFFLFFSHFTAKSKKRRIRPRRSTWRHFLTSFPGILGRVQGRKEITCPMNWWIRIR